MALSRDARTKDARVGEDGRLERIPTNGGFHLRVSRSQLRRALLIMESLVRGAEQRGWTAKESAHSGTGIAIGHRVYAIQIVELTDPIALTKAEQQKHEDAHPLWSFIRKSPPTHRRQANGLLRIQIPVTNRGLRSVWTDGPRGLIETKLHQVLEALAERAEHDQQLSMQLQADADRRLRERERLLAEQRRADLEAARHAYLLAQCDAHDQAVRIRTLVGALRSAGLDAHQVVGEWIRWGTKHAQTLDPLLNPDRWRPTDAVEVQLRWA